jgi:hypothetical protein
MIDSSLPPVVLGAQANLIYIICVCLLIVVFNTLCGTDTNGKKTQPLMTLLPLIAILTLETLLPSMAI